MPVITPALTIDDDAPTRHARLQAVHDYWLGSGSYLSAGTLGTVRANLNNLNATSFANSAEFDVWSLRFAEVNETDNHFARVAALLSTNAGALWDFGIASTIFESADTTDPAEVGDPVQYVTAYRLGTLAAATLLQTQIGRRPSWQSTYANFDGGDNLPIEANGASIYTNCAIAVLAARFQISSLATARGIAGWNGATGSDRLYVRVTTAGAVNVELRRLDGDTVTSVQTANGVITVGLDYTILVTVAFSAGGADAVQIFVGTPGTASVSAALAGTGNTSNTAPTSARIGAQPIPGSAPPEMLAGRIYRVLALRMTALPTVTERTSIMSVMTGA